MEEKKPPSKTDVSRRLWAARREAFAAVRDIEGIALVVRYDDSIPMDRPDPYARFRVWYDGIAVDPALWCAVVLPGADISTLRSIAAVQDGLAAAPVDDTNGGEEDSAAPKKDYAKHRLKIVTSELPVRVRVVTSISTRVFRGDGIRETLERALSTAGDWAAWAARDKETGKLPAVVVDTDEISPSSSGVHIEEGCVRVGWPNGWPTVEEMLLLRLWHKTHRYRVSLQNAEETPVLPCAGGVVVTAPGTPIVEYTGARDRIFGVYGEWFERPRTWRRRTPPPVWELGTHPGPWGWTEYEAWDTSDYPGSEEDGDGE